MLYSLLSSFLLFFLRLAFAYGENPRGYVCDSAINATYTSAFATSLGLALDTLRSNTAATGFSTTTTSVANSTQPAAAVTALALCRGTLNSSDCQTCIEAAVLGIRRVCPDNTNAQVWYTYCMVRYSSHNFINDTSTSVSFMLYDTREVPDGYFPTINALMQNLSAAAGGSDKRYAIAQTREPDYDQPVYGYVDCTRDVDGKSCTNCLMDATSQISSCCYGKWAGWVATPTCNIQFHMEPVHKDWETAPYLDLQLPVAAAPPPETETNTALPVDREVSGTKAINKRFLIRVVAAVMGILLLVVGVSLIIFKVMMKRAALIKVIRRNAKDNPGSGTVDIEKGSLLFDLDVLVAATDNFSDSNLLGKGGFGTVYKGKTGNGEEIAVKKLAAKSVNGKEEFFNEVRLLKNMQHRNLVRLLGCCLQGEEMILVYEYLPNKSLDYFLFDKRKSALLDWQKRHNIIFGVAKGLLYLHQDSALKIVHRDIKASNILLDKQMNPKIADFGLARLFSDEQTCIRTRRIAGTLGYMAPEYAIRGHLSLKNDVFGFGVLLLEIISGRKNFDPQFDSEEQQILKLTWRLQQEGRLMELVDETTGAVPEAIAVRWIQIGLLCTQECLEDRPTMSSILLMLSNHSSVVPAPGRPAYHGHSENNPHFNTQNQRFTGNPITNSLASGR